MIRFLIKEGYRDRGAQAVISEALGVIYDAKNNELNPESGEQNEETPKDNDQKTINEDNEDEDTN